MTSFHFTELNPAVVSSLLRQAGKGDVGLVVTQTVFDEMKTSSYWTVLRQDGQMMLWSKPGDHAFGVPVRVSGDTGRRMWVEIDGRAVVEAVG
jgi:hypothetical protein